MSNMIVGRFQTQDGVADEVEALERLGIARGAISSFYVNPAGAAALPVTGHVAAVIGGCLGSLIGCMNATKERY